MVFSLVIPKIEKKAMRVASLVPNPPTVMGTKDIKLIIA